MTEFPSAFPPSEQPPLQPQYAPPEKKPAWPIVIGIISIVLASLGLLCFPLSIVSNKLNPEAVEWEKSLPDWYSTYTIVVSLFGVGMTIGLLIGGILLIRRRAIARPLHMLYGAFGAFMCILGFVMLFTVVLPSLSAANFPPEREIIVKIVSVVGTIVGAVYPVFLLIWFSRGRIRDQVRSWAAGADLGAQQQTWDIPTAPPPAV